MPATFRQLANRRKANSITRQEMVNRLGCSYKWVTYLESFYQGPCVQEWRARYEQALNEAIEDRKRQRV